MTIVHKRGRNYGGFSEKKKRIDYSPVELNSTREMKEALGQLLPETSSDLIAGVYTFQMRELKLQEMGSPRKAGNAGYILLYVELF